MKQQVVIVGGGETHDNHVDYLKWLGKQEFMPGTKHTGWKDTLQEDLGNDFEVIRTHMPNSQNANFSEWEAYFDTVVDYINEGAILVGHSLGALFLLEYLSRFDIGAKALILIASPAHWCGTFPYEPNWFSGINPPIHIFHSEDDNIVPLKSAYILKSDILKAEMHIFKDKGHFYMQTNFPDLVKVIKKIK